MTMTMKASNEQMDVFTAAFNDQFLDLQKRLLDFHDNMLTILSEKDFDESHDSDFFIKLAEDSVIHQCQKFVYELKAMKSVIDQVNEILDFDDDE